MATFSSTPAAAAANTLSTTSSLSYHHLLTTSNGSNNNNNNNSSHSTSSDENITQGTTINDVNLTNTFDTNSPYLNNADFSLCLSANQQPNPFDVVVSSSTSPSHFNADPLVRHFFNYRQNDVNLTGNYYSNMSTGPFVNAFDYPYTNMTPTTISTGLGTDASVPNHAFASALSSNNPPQHHHHHSHSFANSYMSYPHPQQQILKPTDSFSVPQQQQQSNQQQNIYPWMRRIHNNCGKNEILTDREMKFNSFPSFLFIFDLFFLPYIHNLFYGLFMSFSCL
jgi:hypothetical protein